MGGAGDRRHTRGEGKMNRRRRRRAHQRQGRQRLQGKRPGGLPWWAIAAAVALVALFALSRALR